MTTTQPWWMTADARANALARWGVVYTPVTDEERQHRGRIQKITDEQIIAADRRVRNGLSKWVDEARRHGVERATLWARRKRLGLV